MQMCVKLQGVNVLRNLGGVGFIRLIMANTKANWLLLVVFYCMVLGFIALSGNK